MGIGCKVIGHTFVEMPNIERMDIELVCRDCGAVKLTPEQYQYKPKRYSPNGRVIPQLYNRLEGGYGKVIAIIIHKNGKEENVYNSLF